MCCRTLALTDVQNHAQHESSTAGGARHTTTASRSLPVSDVTYIRARNHCWGFLRARIVPDIRVQELIVLPEKRFNGFRLHFFNKRHLENKSIKIHSTFFSFFPVLQYKMIVIIITETYRDVLIVLKRKRNVTRVDYDMKLEWILSWRHWLLIMTCFHVCDRHFKEENRGVFFREKRETNRSEDLILFKQK